eukprot:TRINITY_DN18344_c0_g1_i4.p2 TRINITY_DN18344_c0_g1~~TRINITY_DN18344_c0_g1_i4.p2  ORF type:complete len:133 (+),score=10.18 TRINITY_DN18344_c0_g1_i4:87-485(+)
MAALRRGLEWACCLLRIATLATAQSSNLALYRAPQSSELDTSERALRNLAKATDGSDALGHLWNAEAGDTGRWLRIDLGARAHVHSMTITGGHPGGFERVRIYRACAHWPFAAKVVPFCPLRRRTFRTEFPL